MSEIHTIYSLCDPESGAVRYVGITRRSLKERLRTHIRFAKDSNNHRSTWIRSVIARGLRPTITTLEETMDVERERWWIVHYRSLGCDLTNGNDGGGGCPAWNEEAREAVRRGVTGFRHTEEAKRKISDAAREQCANRTPEHIAKIANKTRGQVRTPEQRQRMCEAMQKAVASGKRIGHFGPHSDESKAKIGDAVRKARSEGRGLFSMTDEGKRKISLAKKGNQAFLGRKHTPEAIEKMRLAKLGNSHNLGRKCSDETKAKIGARNRERYEQRQLQKGG